MSHYVYSTLTQSKKFTLWEASPNQMPIRVATVFIQGGANCPDKQLVTPKGVMTKVSDEEYETLKKVHTFVSAVKSGYISVESKERKLEKVVRDMEPKDKHAPLTNDDFEQGKEPIVASDPEPDLEPEPRRRGRHRKVA